MLNLFDRNNLNSLPLKVVTSYVLLIQIMPTEKFMTEQYWSLICIDTSIFYWYIFKDITAKVQSLPFYHFTIRWLYPVSISLILVSSVRKKGTWGLDSVLLIKLACYQAAGPGFYLQGSKVPQEVKQCSSTCVPLLSSPSALNFSVSTQIKTDP